MKKYLFPFIIFLGLFLSIRATEVPYLTGRVNDYAQILSQETCNSLSDLLKAHEEKTGNQIAVLTISSLSGENIEDYANTVFNEWGLGEKDKNNGILIVVVPNDRKMRIEVGYGLEGSLPDAKASSIIRNIMAPRFRENDYDAGITDCVNAITEILEGGELQQFYSDENNTTSSGDSFFEMDTPDLSITERILIGAFIFGIIGLFTALGILTPGVGWFLYFFLIPFWAIFPIIVVGTTGAMICLVIYLIGFPVAKILLKKKDWYKKAAQELKTKGSARIGGFTISSGGSSSSWSSGGSSFSGGGGSSGGGGASGSW